MATRPTMESATELQQAFDHFNAVLFDGQLPPCLITLQRKAGCFGYFSRDRFVHVDGVKTDEIAMNPEFFAAYPVIEIFQTMVHEMVHMWQAHFGTPSKRSYHNQEWADKMEGLGLMPSSTGKPGGKRTGEKMADYAIPGGRFLLACDQLMTADFKVSWYDRFPVKRQGGEDGAELAIDVSLLAESGGERPNRSNRVKYRCDDCGAQLWGKPGLNVLCGDCDTAFEVAA